MYAVLGGFCSVLWLLGLLYCKLMYVLRIVLAKLSYCPSSCSCFCCCVVRGVGAKESPLLISVSSSWLRDLLLKLCIVRVDLGV